MADRPCFLGIDLGGTNIKIGVVDDAGGAVTHTSIPTRPEEGSASGLDRMCEAGRFVVQQAGLTMQDIHSVGVGSPGPMDLKKQVLINPHNLPGWWDLYLAAEIEKRLEKQTVLQNDANAAAFGEFWVGAGRGRHSLVQFTLGTGIGCGIVIGGQILEGEHSHGGESGHQRIDISKNARLNGTGLYGSLEAYASAKAVVERATEALDVGEASILADEHRKEGSLTAKVVFDAAAAGDALAERIVDETAFYLAVGAVNLMHTIDPDVVVFSGGMIAAGPTFLERIRRYVRENALPVPAASTDIVYALLGEDAGFIGAAGCARIKFATSRS